MAAGAGGLAETPRPCTASLMRDVVGLPPGDPTIRWATLAANRPMATAATAPVTVAAPSRRAATNWAAITQRPKCRNGRLRCGEAVDSVATASVSAPGGNVGGPLTSPSN